MEVSAVLVVVIGQYQIRAPVTVGGDLFYWRVLGGDNWVEDTIPPRLCHVGVCDQAHKGGGVWKKGPGG